MKTYNWQRDSVQNMQKEKNKKKKKEKKKIYRAIFKNTEQDLKMGRRLQQVLHMRKYPNDY